MGSSEIVPQAQYGGISGLQSRFGGELLGDADKTMALIEQVTAMYRNRIEGDGSQDPETSSILFCLKSAMSELKGDSPLVTEEAHREAIAWLVLALDLGS